MRQKFEISDILEARNPAVIRQMPDTLFQVKSAIPHIQLWTRRELPQTPGLIPAHILILDAGRNVDLCTKGRRVILATDKNILIVNGKPRVSTKLPKIPRNLPEEARVKSARQIVASTRRTLGSEARALHAAFKNMGKVKYLQYFPFFWQYDKFYDYQLELLGTLKAGELANAPPVESNGKSRGSRPAPRLFKNTPR